MREACPRVAGRILDNLSLASYVKPSSSQYSMPEGMLRVSVARWRLISAICLRTYPS